jgi:hypothetical protein
MPMGRGEFQGWCRPEWRTRIDQSITKGIAIVRSPEWYPLRTRVDWTESLKAHARNVHINKQAESLLIDTPGIGIQARLVGNRTFFLVGDKAVFSFKKLDERLYSSSIPTSQSRAFLGQRPIPELADVEEATHIIAGYVFDRVETTLRIYLTCPLGAKNNLWAWKLAGEQAQQSLPPITLPSQARSNGEARRRLAEPKPEKLEERRKRENDGTAG